MSLRSLTHIKSLLIALGIKTRGDEQTIYALSSIAKLLGKPLNMIHLSADTVAPLLAQAYANVPDKMDKSTWRTVRYHFLKALRKVGIHVISSRNLKAADVSTKALLSRVHAKYQKSLTVLETWCSIHGLTFDQLTQAHADQFATDMCNSEDRTHGREQAIRALRAFEDCRTNYDFWPQVVLTRPDTRKRVTFPRKMFDPDYVRHVDEMCAHFLDPPAGRAADHPAITPQHARRRANRIYLATSEAARMLGVPPSLFGSLHDVITVEVLNAAIDQSMLRGLPERCAQHDDIVTDFHAIAKHFLCLDATVYKQLTNFHMRTCIGTRPSAATIELLRRFKNPGLLCDFLKLPIDTKVRIEASEQLLARDRRDAQSACAMAILQNAPVRPQNLARLIWNENIFEEFEGDERSIVVELSESDTKTRRAQRLVLGPEAIVVVEWYLFDIIKADRHAKVPLFVGRGCRTKRPANLSKQLAQFTESFLHVRGPGGDYHPAGQRITGHKFRALVGWIYLKFNPGDIETVRGLLGHANVEVTRQFYVWVNEEEASKLNYELQTRLRNAGQGRTFARAQP